MAQFRQPVYNFSHRQGGGPTKVDLNAQYMGLDRNYAYIMFLIVWLITSGLSLSYSGLAPRQPALVLLLQSFTIAAVSSLAGRSQQHLR